MQILHPPSHITREPMKHEKMNLRFSSCVEEIVEVYREVFHYEADIGDFDAGAVEEDNVGVVEGGG